jgi:hypothetical protein
MGKHTHNHCLHDLKYCDHCDTVYCTKCDREWIGHAHYTWHYYGTPYYVYWGDKSNYTITTTTGTVVDNPDVITFFNSTYKNDRNYVDTIEANRYCTHSC